jgi:hypothetical protein
MKKLLLLLVLILPNSAFAYTGDYCVSGAGTTGANGTYTFNQTGVWVKGTSYEMHDSTPTGSTFTLNGVTCGNAYAELRSYDCTTAGYYYDSSGPYVGDVEHLDTVNNDGTGPVPTVTQGSCTGGGGGGGITVNRLAKFTATTTPTLGDSLFSDDGSNVTLTAGNLFMQVGALIDTVTGGTLNFGTTNATSINIGKSGVTTTFPGPLAVTGLAAFGSNLTVPAGFGLDTASSGALNIGTTTASSITIGKSGITTTIPGLLSWGNLGSTANCNSSASPAVCGASSAGSVAMATGGSTLIVNSTAVTANSQILITEDSSLGTRLGVTCNTSANHNYSISARTPGTSFTITSSNNISTNKACLSFLIIN